MTHCLIVSILLTLILLKGLHGAPDPDLFDGRLVTSRPSASVDRTDEKDEHESGMENSVDTGDTDDTDHTKGSNGNGSNDRVDNEGVGQEQDIQAVGTDEASDGSKNPGRNFDEFTVGATGAGNTPIEPNSSKEFEELSTNSPPRELNQTNNSDVNNSEQEGLPSDSTNPETDTRKASADYGTNLPTGL